MSRRITDEELGKDPLLQRLSKRPVERRMPSGTQIAHIQREAAEPVQRTRRTRRLAIGWSAALVSLIVLLGAFVYVYDKPGGIADWRYSRAAGYSDTIRIPIGRTPEEAVRKFRQYAPMRVIHEETIGGGVLLFIKRFEDKAGTYMDIEFVQHNLLGWKWAMGGGYGYSSLQGIDVALDYMSLPKFPGIHGPFPIIFGQIQNASIAGVNVTFGGPEAGMKAARIIEYEPGKRVWYATLPQSADASYGIEAVDEQGNIRANKSFEDPRDSSYLVMNKTKP
ncbi:hypothetical protein [Paenibacillus sacheonensis]|uniref:Uncharacterized protein n=1 Tax=Paenibacillus sacheonensis TaxID=742054 RepID=A0A7X4YPJ1_9BACL|nr:hypothetical protein [Paenibacillus sacheonensis]MBM7565110.1 hypothetical protein [Paenibacillus sacheonensis]NBC70107.1 hypothetical protein [Paenibacillus sacheonensis]